MIYNKLAVIVLLSVSLAAQADPISDIQKSNPNVSPFEVLRILYNQSTLPAAPTDFDWQNDRSSNQYCSFALVSSTLPQPFSIARVDYVLVAASPATSAQGPLFPARQAQLATTTPVLNFQVGTRADLSEFTNQDHVEISLSSTELTETDSYMQSSITTNVIKLNFRKKADLIPFHITEHSVIRGDSEAYGYCYRQ